MKKLKRFIKKIYLFVFEFIFFNIRGVCRRIISIFDSNYKTLSHLKGIHEGERCFIVATGPSLRIEDLDKLKEEYSFSVNSIFLATQETDWRSTYYVCLDERHFDNMLKKYPNQINEICKENKFFNITTRKSNINSLKKIEKKLFIPISRINQLNYTGKRNPDKFFFRTNPVQGIYNSGTVTNSAIILAMYMGFNKIYLLGTDCNYSDKIKHVGEDWNDKTMSINEQELIELRMKNGFEEISKMAKKYNVEIYNATRGGMLESFPRINFDDIVFEEKEAKKR